MSKKTFEDCLSSVGEKLGVELDKNPWGLAIYTEAAELLAQARVEELKICKGCGRRSDRPIDEKYIACCPDSNYIPLDEFIDKARF